ncbi:DUF58 domain-containing protein [Pseudoalteromonas sp. MMG024]|uniref:DUF58 domain-containing protein n=1 Tax=Pseudoalteromonas sp. MMG024 TaxID=2909980 RepID=UPI001F239CE0|nr:DUF58 domain-containing protein [Pseudoalteromonas sp. MMG024]MCF6457067.1 DUF58 domain-containing protein [Pseudoalteromonas sp. MMG024]
MNTQTAQLAELQSNGVELSLNELMAYHNKTTLLELTPKRKVKHHNAGQYLAPHKGRGMEFAEVRHYQPGDDVRAIDWRVTARTGIAHTKLFQEEKERPVFILTDFSDSMIFGSQLLLKSVQAAHLSALIAWSAIQRGDRVGGLVFNHNAHWELKPASRQSAALKLFHNLQLAHHAALSSKLDGESQTLNDQLNRLVHLAKPGSLVYLISDFHHLSEDMAKQLLLLTRHCELIACPIFDPMERALPNVGEQLSLKSGNRQASLPLANAKFRESYAAKANAQQNTLYQLLHKSGLALMPFSAAQSITEQLKG